MFKGQIYLGMDWLDQQDAIDKGTPWFRRIDTGSEFSMCQGGNCVLGQVCPGGYDFDEITSMYGWAWAVERGFTLESWRAGDTTEGRDVLWHQLAEEWRLEIKLRQVDDELSHQENSDRQGSNR